MTRRDEILRAAQHAFLKYGLNKITLDDIAQECGIKKTALYYYFNSKDEILAQMILLKLQEYRDLIVEAVNKTRTVRERLRTYMFTKISIMQNNTPFFKLFEKEGLPSKAKNFLNEHKKKIMNDDFKLVKSIIAQGIENKKISFQMKDSLALMILGVTYGTFVGKFLENTDWDIDSMIDTAIEVIFKGIE